MKVFRSWFNRIIVLVGFLVLMLFVMDLNSRMVHMIQLRGEMETELAKVNELKTIEAALDKQIAYAESNGIVEKWARQENRMQKQGDFVIVLLPSGEPQPETVTELSEPLPELDNWEAWKLWLTFQE
ncbi:MAG: hypothetical protein P8Y68_03705 [Anaerolineales bacterium]|jgi:hypothetical protein